MYTLIEFDIMNTAAITTFIRFFPRIKARYDYGFLIFILTFCLVSVSGYRDDEILQVAYRRALTILLGTFIAILICLFICPVWAGDDLHSLVSNNIQLLANFLQGVSHSLAHHHRIIAHNFASLSLIIVS